jgi:hypothetical protein
MNILCSPFSFINHSDPDSTDTPRKQEGWRCFGLDFCEPGPERFPLHDQQEATQPHRRAWQRHDTGPETTEVLHDVAERLEHFSVKSRESPRTTQPHKQSQDRKPHTSKQVADESKVHEKQHHDEKRHFLPSAGTASMRAKRAAAAPVAGIQPQPHEEARQSQQAGSGEENHAMGGKTGKDDGKDHKFRVNSLSHNRENLPHIHRKESSHHLAHPDHSSWRSAMHRSVAAAIPSLMSDALPIPIDQWRCAVSGRARTI